MGKRIALTDYFEIDGNDISYWTDSINFTSEDNEVDVSGFTATGRSESLPGDRKQTVTAEIMIDRETDATFGLLWYLHNTRATFTLIWRADQSSEASPTNPELRGNAKLYNFPTGAARGEVDKATFTFACADENGFAFFQT